LPRRARLPTFIGNAEEETPVSDSTAALPVAPAAEDRMLPAVVYGLYLIGLANGLTILVGLIVAYANKAQAGPLMRSHYIFQIHTFWLSIVWAVIGGALMLFGAPLSLVLIGIPFFLLGLAIVSLLGVWFAIRCIIGAVYLAQGEAHPRPRNWLF